MNGDQHGIGALRERFANGTEDRLGRALGDLLDHPVISGAIGRAFDARERAAQAQELAMGALNLPSAADLERLTRRLRSLSQRLEGIEDSLSRIDRGTGQRLSAIEEQLGTIAARVQELSQPAATKPAVGRAPRSAAASRGASTASRGASAASRGASAASRGASAASRGASAASRGASAASRGVSAASRGAAAAKPTGSKSSRAASRAKPKS